MKPHLYLGALACAVLLLALVACGATSGTAKTLQHDGGARITLRAACLAAHATCDLDARLSAAIGILEQRASAAGYHDVAVRKGSAAQTIVVEAPGVGDGQQLVPLFTSRGQLFFIDTGGAPLPVGADVADRICDARCLPGQYAIVFTGEELDQTQVSAGTDPNSHQPVVSITFKGDAKARFAEYTRMHIGQYLTIALDNKVIESAVIQSEISGPAQISGNLTTAQANTLAAILTSSALPLALTLVSVEQAPPTARS
jgi:preprotein translocase subunit SecD